MPLPYTCRGPIPPACFKVAGEEELPAKGVGSACPNMQVEQRPECDMRLAVRRRQSFLLSELDQNQVRAFSERNKSWPTARLEAAELVWSTCAARLLSWGVSPLERVCTDYCGGWRHRADLGEHSPVHFTARTLWQCWRQRWVSSG